MSGVIDEKGVQWEHCSVCSKMVKLSMLGYEPPSDAHKNGRDICIVCVNKLSQRAIKRVLPATDWKKVLT